MRNQGKQNVSGHMLARGERTATRNKMQATKNSRSRKPGEVTLRDISLLRVFGGRKGAGDTGSRLSLKT